MSQKYSIVYCPYTIPSWLKDYEFRPHQIEYETDLSEGKAEILDLPVEAEKTQELDGSEEDGRPDDVAQGLVPVGKRHVVCIGPCRETGGDQNSVH